ncbi:hypothetical protein RRF57_003048 [Xylaria bambusicola]|uniref:Uncharacterized protein n=1 Tax=Xylaria bambusicola TaxID=326684 RepID=A0AAN7UFH8_9PEZI
MESRVQNVHSALREDLISTALCTERDGLQWDPEMIYTKLGFLEHFRRCKQAQLLWESSENGQKLPHELPEVARTHGYFGATEAIPEIGERKTRRNLPKYADERHV